MKHILNDNNMITSGSGIKRSKMKSCLFVTLTGIFMIPCSFSFYKFARNSALLIDSLQYPQGYPNPSFSAIEQLQHYPSPRYLKENKLIRLFN